MLIINSIDTLYSYVVVNCIRWIDKIYVVFLIVFVFVGIILYLTFLYLIFIYVLFIVCISNR